jgi:hypothetical protein
MFGWRRWANLRGLSRPAADERPISSALMIIPTSMLDDCGKKLAEVIRIVLLITQR